jgi:hypothetical protein
VARHSRESFENMTEWVARAIASQRRRRRYISGFPGDLVLARVGMVEIEIEFEEEWLHYRRGSLENCFFLGKRSFL